MRERAIYYYRQGYNCSQCLMKAAQSRYRLNISRETMNSLSGVNSGFGIGGLCSVLIAAIMVFGLLFDENRVKVLRLKLLTAFTAKYGTVNCGALMASVENGSCESIVGDIAEMMEKLISEERGYY